MDKKEALTQLEIMATNATGRLGSAKSEEEKALLSKEIEALDMAMDALKDYKPKTGHWIEDAKTYYEELIKKGLGVDEYTPYFTDDIACSECLAKYSVLDNETQFFKHCPNCGAKMERGNL